LRVKLHGEPVKETVPLHRIDMRYRASEEWANAGIDFNASQYLH